MNNLTKILFVVGLAFVASSHATPVTLDTTFDSDGIVLTSPVPGMSAIANGMTLQSDGKLVVVGVSNGNIVIARYNTNGSLDTSFDSDGIVLTNISGSNGAYVAYAVKQQADGKLVVFSGGSSIVSILTRYNVNGSLDTSFGSNSNGIATLTSVAVSDCHWGTNPSSTLVQQADGKWIVLGVCFWGESRIVRLSANGVIDTTFGSNGVVISSDIINAITLQPDGKIVGGGCKVVVNIVPKCTDFRTVRYNSNGAIDTTFGTSGEAITNVSGVDSVAALMIQPDGKILVAGNGTDVGPITKLVRYNSDGSIDPGFGTSGIVQTDVSAGNEYVHGLAAVASNKILLIGSANNGVSDDVMLVRYNNDGSLDAGFDGDGIFLFDTGGKDSGNAFALQIGDKVAVAGASKVSGTDQFLVGEFVLPSNTDTDGDGIIDSLDTDDDNDGVLDVNDAFPLDASESVDTDNDGVGNNADTDDDNDGVLDINDAFPLDASESVDTDNDGVGNNADTDDDNDGVLDVNDAFPLDASESVDTDNDGVGNNADTDDDNDGVLDINDAFPLDTSESVDTDGDSVGDNADNCPLISNTDQLNTDGDTYGDVCDSTPNGVVPYDFDGDGDADILFRNVVTGQNVIWLLQNGLKSSVSALTTNALTFEVAAILDGDNDGDADILWYDSVQGKLIFWQMQNGVKQANAFLGNTTATLVGVGDFDGDGDSDILLKTSLGDIKIWTIQNLALALSTNIGTPGGTYQVIDTGDFNGDGIDDIVMQNASGLVRIWQLNSSATVARVIDVGSISTVYKLKKSSDTDNDGDDDLIFRNDSTGQTVVWEMQNGARASVQTLSSPNPSMQLVTVTDFDKDGDEDLLFRDTTVGDASDGDTIIWKMQNNTKESNSFLGNNDINFVLESAADFDGDGDKDILYRNMVTGQVLIWNMQGGAKVGNYNLGTISTNWQMRF